MWYLELYILKTSRSGFADITHWDKVESIEKYSELQQWQQIAIWKEQHNLNFAGVKYFIFLTRESHGVLNYDEHK